MAIEAFRKLPDNFRALCADLVIRIDDFATDEVLDHLGARSEFDVLGLFQGVGLPFRSESAPVQMPNMIWLYRRPILDYWSEHDETSGRDRHACAGARDRASFRHVGCGHGSDRTGSRLTDRID